jgi:hypothetical protein
MKRRSDASSSLARRFFRMCLRSYTGERLGATGVREVENPGASFRLHTRRAGREFAEVRARDDAPECEDHDVGSAPATTRRACRSSLGN